METVLIADDEENIREGIKLIIDWEELGFEIAGDASNGEEALLAIQKLNPSLVVMDMQINSNFTETLKSVNPTFSFNVIRNPNQDGSAFLEISGNKI